MATGVSADGRREVLGCDVGDSENEVFWTDFLRTLKARGLGGTQLVISDAHTGLKAAIGAVLLGSSWQRCRVHWACKESTCGRVAGRLRNRSGGKERGRGGKPLLGGHWGVADLLKNHGDLTGRGAEGAPADLEQLGQRLVAA